MPRPLGALLAVALAAPTWLVAATPASAERYDVTFDVALELRHDHATEWANFGALAERGSARVDLRGRLTGVRVDAGRLAADGLGLLPSGPPAEVTAATGASEASTDGLVDGRCTVTAAEAVGAPRLAAAHDGALRFSPLEALRLTRSCDRSGTDTSTASGVDRDGPQWLAGPIVARLAPPSGEQRVVRELTATAPLTRCGDAGATGTCTITLSGTVTFDRVDQEPAPEAAPPRWPRPPRAQPRGPVDRRDNIFVFRIARVDVDGRLLARVDRRPAGEPPSWGELDMALAWHRRFPGPGATDRMAGWWSVGGWRGHHGSFWMPRQRLTWRGRAAYDRGVVRRLERPGPEWRHAAGGCPDLRWRPRTGIGGSFGAGPGGRIAVRLTLPSFPHHPATCDAVGLGAERLERITTRATLPATAVRRPRLTIPFAETRVLTDRRRGRELRRELRIAGSVTLERVDACRNPPEYPCNARFFDG